MRRWNSTNCALRLGVIGISTDLNRQGRERPRCLAEISSDNSSPETDQAHPIVGGRVTGVNVARRQQDSREWTGIQFPAPIW